MTTWMSPAKVVGFLILLGSLGIGSTGQAQDQKQQLQPDPPVAAPPPAPIPALPHTPSLTGASADPPASSSSDDQRSSPAASPSAADATIEKQKLRGVLVEEARPVTLPTGNQHPPKLPSSTGSESPALEKLVATRIQREAQRQTTRAQALIAQDQVEEAARAFALAYANEPTLERLLGVARARRRSGDDVDAQLAYQRAGESAEGERSVYQAEIEEALRALAVKIEDPEGESAQRIRDHMETAKRRFQDAQYSAAAEEYALAYAAKRLPRFLFNIAQAYRRASKAEESYLLYRRFLAEDPATPLRKEAEGYMTELRAVAFRPPVYRRPWFWGVLGGSVAVVIAGAVALGVGLSPRDAVTDGGIHDITFGLSQ